MEEIPNELAVEPAGVARGMVEVGLATVVTLGIVVEFVLGKWVQSVPPDSVRTDNRIRAGYD